MKRTIFAVVLLATGLTVVYGYTVTRRERLYRQLVAQGDHALARGDTFGAIAAFGDAIGLKPESMLGYLKRGDGHRRRGDLEAAARDLDRAAMLDPTAPRVLELLGDVEAGRQLHDLAAGHYAASLRLDDRSPRVLYKLGLSRYIAGHHEAACEALTKAVTLDARFAEAHYLLGVCLGQLNHGRDAEVALKRAVLLSPGLLTAREQLAELYGSTGRRMARIAELERLLAADPAPARQVTLALAHAAAGQTARAVGLLRRATELYPDYAGTYLALGRIWMDAAGGSRDPVALGKALEALQQAVSMDPSGTALAELGKALAAAGDAVAAERAFRQAADALPADSSVFLHLADSAERAGDHAAARRALLDHHAVAADAGRLRPVAQRIGALSIRLREPAVAVQWYTLATQQTDAAPALLVRLADAQWQAGESAAARATLARVLREEPDYGPARALERQIADR